MTETDTNLLLITNYIVHRWHFFFKISLKKSLPSLSFGH